MNQIQATITGVIANFQWQNYGLATGILKYTSGATSPSIAIASDINNTFGPQSQNLFYASPNGSIGLPSFRSIVSTDLPNFSSILSGIVPASGGGTTNFLRADGTWATPPGTGGGWAVTGTTNLTGKVVVNSFPYTALSNSDYPLGYITTITGRAGQATDEVIGENHTLNVSAGTANQKMVGAQFDVYPGGSFYSTSAMRIRVNGFNAFEVYRDNTLNGATQAYIGNFAIQGGTGTGQLFVGSNDGSSSVYCRKYSSSQDNRLHFGRYLDGAVLFGSYMGDPIGNGHNLFSLNIDRTEIRTPVDATTVTTAAAQRGSNFFAFESGLNNAGIGNTAFIAMRTVASTTVSGYHELIWSANQGLTGNQDDTGVVPDGTHPIMKLGNDGTFTGLDGNGNNTLQFGLYAGAAYAYLGSNLTGIRNTFQIFGNTNSGLIASNLTPQSDGIINITNVALASKHVFNTGAGTETITANVTQTGNYVLNGNLGISMSIPLSKLHIAAGSAIANTAPIQLTAGPLETIARTGIMEYDGTNLYFTRIGTTRGTLIQSDAVNIVTPTLQNRTITINIGGTTLYLTAKTTND